MIRRPPRSTQSRSSAASDVYKRQVQYAKRVVGRKMYGGQSTHIPMKVLSVGVLPLILSLIHISEPTRPY